MIDLHDPEYAMPGELASQYDLRTGPERLHAQVDDHQRRIAELEQRISRLERLMLPRTNHLYADEAADAM